MSCHPSLWHSKFKSDSLIKSHIGILLLLTAALVVVVDSNASGGLDVETNQLDGVVGHHHGRRMPHLRHEKKLLAAAAETAEEENSHFYNNKVLEAVHAFRPKNKTYHRSIGKVTNKTSSIKAQQNHHHQNYNHHNKNNHNSFSNINKHDSATKYDKVTSLRTYASSTWTENPFAVLRSATSTDRDESHFADNGTKGRKQSESIKELSSIPNTHYPRSHQNRVNSNAYNNEAVGEEEEVVVRGRTSGVESSGEGPSSSSSSDRDNNDDDDENDQEDDDDNYFEADYKDYDNEETIKDASNKARQLAKVKYQTSTTTTTTTTMRPTRSPPPRSKAFRTSGEEKTYFGHTSLVRSPTEKVFRHSPRRYSLWNDLSFRRATVSREESREGENFELQADDNKPNTQHNKRNSQYFSHHQRTSATEPTMPPPKNSNHHHHEDQQPLHHNNKSALSTVSYLPPFN